MQTRKVRLRDKLIDRMLSLKVTDAEKKILYAITKRGPSTQSELAKETALHYTTVHEAIKLFEEARWVRFLREELSQKNMPMKLYGPSARLLILTLFQDFCPDEKRQKLWPNIDQVAQKNKAVLPLILGKWDYFTKEKLGDLAKGRLKLTIMRAYVNPIYDFISLPLSGETLVWHEKSIASLSYEDENRFWIDTLRYYFYGPAQFYTFERTPKGYQMEHMAPELLGQEDKWLECVCHDRELKELLRVVCERRDEEIKTSLQMLQKEVKRFKAYLSQNDK